MTSYGIGAELRHMNIVAMLAVFVAERIVVAPTSVPTDFAQCATCRMTRQSGWFYTAGGRICRCHLALFHNVQLPTFAKNGFL